MRIKAVIFDLDDTLIHSGINYSEVKSSIIDFLVKCGVDKGLLDENMPNFEIIGRAVRDLRRKNFPEPSIRRIVNGAIAMLNDAELKSLDRARPMEEALEALMGLRGLGLRIGIVTNSCAAYTRKVIEMFSLGEHVDAVVTRDEVSSPKPNPAPLLRILEVLGVDASEALFVGDHLIDALCARGCGVRFILLKNKKWNLVDSEKMASAVIDNLSQLQPLIQRLHGLPAGGASNF